MRAGTKPCQNEGISVSLLHRRNRRSHDRACSWHIADVLLREIGDDAVAQTREIEAQRAETTRCQASRHQNVQAHRSDMMRCSGIREQDGWQLAMIGFHGLGENPEWESVVMNDRLTNLDRRLAIKDA